MNWRPTRPSVRTHTRESDHVFSGEANVPKLLHEGGDAGGGRGEVVVGAQQARRAAILPADLHLPTRPAGLHA